MAVLGCLLLTGCETVQEAYDSKLTLEGPVDWWHQLQGGQIAEQRPPPPGVTDPYPNLGQIPARPTPMDPATRRALLTRLAAQRDRTKQEAAQEPIVWPVPDSPKPPAPASAPPVAAQAPATAPPSRAAPASPPPTAAPPPDDAVSTMVFEGASAAPAPAQPPPRAQPDPNPPSAFAPAARQAARPAASGPVVSGPIPALPAAAPPPPALSGIPASTFAPATPRPRPSVSFSFPPGSAALPGASEAALRALAARRAGAAIQVTAGGDARSAAPVAQEAALPLALRRTGAITAVLIGAGVPAGSIRAEAAAAGRGGSARLVE